MKAQDREAVRLVIWADARRMQEVFTVRKILLSLFVLICTLGAASVCLADEGIPNTDLPSVLMQQQTEEFKNDKGQVCIRTEYNRLLVKNREAFPALAEALEEKHNRVWKEKLAADLEESKPDAIELKKNRPEDYMYFLLEERLWQKHADRNVISFYGEFYQNRGGARPDIEIYTYNFNPVTGKLYTLHDALAPRELANFVQNAVKPALQQYKEKNGLFFYDNYLTIVDELFAKDYQGEQPLNWVWGEAGMTLYFGPDVLAPRVIGPVEIAVPVKGFEHLFNEQFKNPSR